MIKEKNNISHIERFGNSKVKKLSDVQEQIYCNA